MNLDELKPMKEKIMNYRQMTPQHVYYGYLKKTDEIIQFAVDNEITPKEVIMYLLIRVTDLECQHILDNSIIKFVRDDEKSVAGAHRLFEHLDKVRQGKSKPAYKGAASVEKVVKLYHAGYSYEDISLALKVSKSTVNRRLHEAKKQGLLYLNARCVAYLIKIGNYSCEEISRMYCVSLSKINKLRDEAIQQGLIG